MTMTPLRLPSVLRVPGSYRVVCLSAIAALVAFPAVLSGQSLIGRVFDFTTEIPVATAEVSLLGETGSRPLRTVVADSAGRFVMEGLDEGTYRLRMRRIGYLEVTTPPFELRPGEPTRVELTASPHAIPVAPLTVVARPRSSPVRRISAGFYEREAAWGSDGLGMGHFLGPEELDDMPSSSRASDYLRGLSGVYIGGGGGMRALVEMRATTDFHRHRCIPLFYLDGQLIRGLGSIDGLVAPSDISAIEVYPGINKPAQFAHLTESQCGSIVIWTGPR